MEDINNKGIYILLGKLNEAVSDLKKDTEGINTKLETCSIRIGKVREDTAIMSVNLSNHLKHHKFISKFSIFITGIIVSILTIIIQNIMKGGN